MGEPEDKLNSAASAILKKYPALEIAAKHFVALIERDDDLRTTLALLYLREIDDNTLHARRRRGAHRRPKITTHNNKMPTKAQREASVKARSKIASVVFDRKLRGGKVLGELHVRELRAMTAAQLETSMKFLGNSYVDLVDFVALQKDRAALRRGRSRLAGEGLHQERNGRRHLRTSGGDRRRGAARRHREIRRGGDRNDEQVGDESTTMITVAPRDLTPHRDLRPRPASSSLASSELMPGSTFCGRHAVVDTQCCHATASPAKPGLTPTRLVPGSPFAAAVAHLMP